MKRDAREARALCIVIVTSVCAGPAGRRREGLRGTSPWSGYGKGRDPCRRGIPRPDPRSHSRLSVPYAGESLVCRAWQGIILTSYRHFPQAKSRVELHRVLAPTGAASDLVERTELLGC